MKFALMPFISLVSAQSWLTCPPSFNTLFGRSGSTTGPCDGSISNAPITKVNAGDKLKVGWPSNNRAGGAVRLSLVPETSATSQSNFDRNVLKQTCFGYDGRSGRSAFGFCNHPCNGRPGCQYSSDDTDVDKYDTVITIPYNLANGIYVLQWVAYTGNIETPYYSCSKLQLSGGNPNLNCPRPKQVPQVNCYHAFGPDREKLLENTSAGTFCYEPRGTGTVDGNYCQPPVNAECDPRLSCSLSINSDLCRNELSGIVGTSFPKQEACAFEPQVCNVEKYSPTDFCAIFKESCVMLCLGRSRVMNTCVPKSGLEYNVQATCVCSGKDNTAIAKRNANEISCAKAEFPCSSFQTVKSGDTCRIIADTASITIQKLLSMNPDLNCDNLQIGIKICTSDMAVPVTPSQPVQVKSTRTVPEITRTPTSSASPKCESTRTIKSGDTCYQITISAGITLSSIYVLNPGINCNNLSIGEKICVAGSSAPIPSPVEPPQPQPLPRKCTARRRVRENDSCNSIAKNARISLSLLSSLNPGLNCSNLNVGDRLCIRASYT